MKMMRDNPSIMASAQKMMEKMSPAELQASSKVKRRVALCALSQVQYKYFILSIFLLVCVSHLTQFAFCLFSHAY